MKNIQSTIDRKVLEEQNQRLIELAMCTATTCHADIKPWPPHKFTWEKYGQHASKKSLDVNNDAQMLNEV